MRLSGRRQPGQIFDIPVDVEKIGSPGARWEQNPEFFEAEYPVPERLTVGKQRIMVRFQAHPNASAGGVFDLRVVQQP